MARDASGAPGNRPPAPSDPPLTRREARAREQGRSAEQTRRSQEQQVLSQRRAAEQARGEDTGVIRPVRPDRPDRPERPDRPDRPDRPQSKPTSRPQGRPEPRPVGPPKPSDPVITGVLLACAIMLLVWAGSAFVASSLPVTHLLAALSPLVTVLALPVIAFSAGRRALVSGVLAGVAAIVPWTFAAGYAAAGPGPTSVQGSSKTLRLMYLDAADGSADPDSVTAVARDQGVDVVVMTGLSDAFSHDLAVAGLNRLVTPRWVSITRGSSDGIGVWSRQGEATLELVPGTGMPVGQGLLTTPAGTLDLIVAQLPGSVLAPGAGWAGELKTLAALPARSRDRVLVGDLNATPWQPAFRSFGNGVWHDAADVVGRGLRPTWPSWSPLPIAPTDHVLLSSGMGASAADTVRVAGTSHRAVVVTVIVPD